MCLVDPNFKMSLSHAIRVIVKSVLISKDIILYYIIYMCINYLSSFKANKYLANNVKSIKNCQIMVRNCNKMEIKLDILIYQ